nr:hypothetical protein [Gordonia sp. LAM0048]
MRLVVCGTLALGVVLLATSFLLADLHPWASNALTGLGVTVFLIAPGAWIGGKIQSAIDRVDETAKEAKSTADHAQAENRRLSNSLDDLQQAIVAQQQAEHLDELQTYQDVLEDLTRVNLLRALRHAIDSALLSERLILCSIWQTDLFYRYEIGDDILAVSIETLSGDQRSRHEWAADEPAKAFFQRLVQGVRDAGADLGTGLNVPTESVDRLMKMIMDVTRLRSQELLGYRATLQTVILRDGLYEDDQWYYTEKALVPAHRPSYEIEYSRLSELDWEAHLRTKGWSGGARALDQARVLSSRLETSPGDSTTTAPGSE